MSWALHVVTGNVLELVVYLLAIQAQEYQFLIFRLHMLPPRYVIPFPVSHIPRIGGKGVEHGLDRLSNNPYQHWYNCLFARLSSITVELSVRCA